MCKKTITISKSRNLSGPENLKEVCRQKLASRILCKIGKSNTIPQFYLKLIYNSINCKLQKGICLKFLFKLFLHFNYDFALFASRKAEFISTVI